MTRGSSTYCRWLLSEGWLGAAPWGPTRPLATSGERSLIGRVGRTPSVNRSGQDEEVAALGGPHQVVKASLSPVPVPLPTQAT